MQLTPAQVQDRLFAVHQDMASAANALKVARDKEVTTAETLRMEVARVTLSPECPRPKRGEDGVTVAYRDAWVDEQVATARFNHAVAEAMRKAAEDALRVSRDQASVVQSLSALMRAEMSLTATAPGA